MSADVLKIYRSLSRKPLGHWLFSRLICFKAPYFGSIGPRMVRLEPGRGEATIRHRRSVTNHLGPCTRSRCATWPSSSAD